MDVVRDVLDTLLVDRNGREMGRVDGIVLDLHEGAAPALSEILVGPSTLGSRLHATIGRWIAAIELACGLGKDRPVRIRFNDVEIGDRIRCSCTISETSAGAVEHAVRRVIAKIPGGG